MTAEELDELRRLMKEQFGGKEPRDFQVDMVQAQEERRDALCQAATGQGKTAIAAGPYVLKKNEGKVTFMISPLIGLQNEMVTTFEEEYKVSAIAVNSAQGGCTAETMRAIVAGKKQIVLISPEMLLSRRFIDSVLRNQELASRVYSVIIDEAHCISHWGAEFRKQYAQIGMIRVFLPRSTPFIAVSASLTRRVTRDIVEKLQLSRSTFLYKNLGNDRPNVSIVVRAIHNTMSSYTDLDFVIPTGVQTAEDIPKTWIYADNINTGSEIIDHLRTLIPNKLQGVIRPYNAVLGNDYRDAAMKAFRSGEVRVMICTDAAGMGCNIPDIEVVVQWKLPEKLSSFIQRAGRAARGPGMKGLAVLLVEPSTYSVLLTEVHELPARGRGRGKKKGKQTARKKRKNMKQYARERGRFRGSRSGNQDDIVECEQPPFDPSDQSEGLYLFVQKTTCRRRVLQVVFENPDPNPSVPCCDICVKQKGTAAPKTQYEETPLAAIEHALDDWREDIFTRDESSSYFLEPSCILPDEAIRRLASLKLPLHAGAIEGFLSRQWSYWPKYGEELTQHLLSIDTSPPHNTPPSASTMRPELATPMGENASNDVSTAMRAGNRKRCHSDAEGGVEVIGDSEVPTSSSDAVGDVAGSSSQSEERARKRVRKQLASIAPTSGSNSHDFSVFQATGYSHTPGPSIPSPVPAPSQSQHIQFPLTVPPHPLPITPAPIAPSSSHQYLTSQFLQTGNSHYSSFGTYAHSSTPHASGYDYGQETPAPGPSTYWPHYTPTQPSFNTPTQHYSPSVAFPYAVHPISTPTYATSTFNSGFSQPPYVLPPPSQTPFILTTTSTGQGNQTMPSYSLVLPTYNHSSYTPGPTTQDGSNNVPSRTQ
ncbi:P-loop containing nucleoside triphosphate hydrolase protein [Artomyces pyxidatus]|uniref:P-loop containing nucleoside triphosphate hydrolase protein n=1 Tax=Artomyces pyxidatus TaxID=48021 RepID=A0ACB8SDZ2_9AGAM|nr:P-loop containing nucleoside triphosphate hydrolase protein [Artomyces pyxidatus]